MTTLSSTVPAAVGTLVTAFQAVATANPDLQIGVYLGPPLATVNNNFLSIADPDTGNLLTAYHQDFRGMPAVAGRKNEDYGIRCKLRVWAGDTPDENDPTVPLARLVDAFTLLDGVLGQLQGDVNADGSITPAGDWQVTDVDVPAMGPIGNKGWGVVVDFTVSVRNAIIQAS